MPVLNKGSKAPKTNAISPFSGMAVQHYTVFEVEYVADLMSNEDEKNDLHFGVEETS